MQGLVQSAEQRNKVEITTHSEVAIEL